MAHATYLMQWTSRELPTSFSSVPLLFMGLIKKIRTSNFLPIRSAIMAKANGMQKTSFVNGNKKILVTNHSRLYDQQWHLEKTIRETFIISFARSLPENF